MGQTRKSFNIPIDLFDAEKNTEIFYKVSDPFSFYKKGIAVIFLTGAEEHPQSTDDPEKIDLAKLWKVSRLLCAPVI